MTKYELMRWVTFPIMPVLLDKARKDIIKLLRIHKVKNMPFSILDVGGRKSPYTIHVDADITLLDIPQENSTQEQLNLGFTSELLDFIKTKRSNIKDIIIQDMTKSTLPDASFNAVVCVEVIEHVGEDDIFVKNIAKVIKPGGWAYFTTPNGDYIKNEPPDYNPDHIRHYTKVQLQNLLKKHFSKVEIIYAVKTGKYRFWGYGNFSLRKPFRLIKSITGNIINRFESRGVENTSKRTGHLIARVYK